MARNVTLRMIAAALAAGALTLACARQADEGPAADAATATGKGAPAADVAPEPEEDLAGDEAANEGGGDPSSPEPNAPPAMPGETGGMCGGIAAIMCRSEADYCATAEGECGRIADLAGVCRGKPEICTMDYNPVCGCDGATYANACAAASAGVSVKSRGECPKE
jgi:hypothetical protein